MIITHIVSFCLLVFFLSFLCTSSAKQMNDGVGNSRYYKTQPCSKYFNEGQCNWGSKCNFAHSTEELREPPPQQQVCRLFLHNNFCSYGDTCRFLHVNLPNPNISHAQHPQQSQLGRSDGHYSSARWGAMQNFEVAANVSTGSLHRNEPSRNIAPGGQPPAAPQIPHSGHSSTVAAPAAAAATVDASPSSDRLYKYVEDGVVKFFFNKKKIKGIYGDWID